MHFNCSRLNCSQHSIKSVGWQAFGVINQMVTHLVAHMWLLFDAITPIKEFVDTFCFYRVPPRFVWFTVTAARSRVVYRHRSIACLFHWFHVNCSILLSYFHVLLSDCYILIAQNWSIHVFHNRFVFNYLVCFFFDLLSALSSIEHRL